MKELADKVLQIIEDCHSLNAKSDVKVSTLLNSAIRIARLRNDFMNLLWLRLEEWNILEKEHKMEIFAEVSPHLTEKQYKYYSDSFLKRLREERTVNVPNTGTGKMEDQMFSMSIPETEEEIKSLKSQVDNINTPDGLHSLDLYYRSEQDGYAKTLLTAKVGEMHKILARVRTRVMQYISQTETNISHGKIQSDIFEENKRFVDLELQNLCPSGYEKLVTIYERLKTDCTENWSEALLSCRRLLNDFADSVYPPTKNKVICSDGQERILGKDQYKNRLWQYVSENYKGTSSQVIRDELDYLCNRIDSLYELSCKGIHSSVDRFEANQCVIYTYLLIGDILRIRSKNTLQDRGSR